MALAAAALLVFHIALTALLVPGLLLALAFVGFTLAAVFLTNLGGIGLISMVACLESIAVLFLAWMNVRRYRRFG